MVNHTDIAQFLNELIADFAGAIFAAVVHHNDLKSGSQCRHRAIGVLHDDPNICLFVKCRKND